MPPRKKSKEATVTRVDRVIPTRSKMSQESSKQSLEEMEKEEEITSPQPSLKVRTTAEEKKTLQNVSDLGLDNLSGDEETEKKKEDSNDQQSDTETRVNSDEEKEKEEKRRKEKLEVKERKSAQLKKDADQRALKLRKSLEADERRKVKEKEKQYSKSQLEKMVQEREFMDNLSATLSAAGTPASDAELNEALIVYRTDPSLNLGVYTFYVRGIQRGIAMKGSRVESDLKKVCELFNSTHKLYQATQKSMEKTHGQMASMVFGSGSLPKPSTVSTKPPKPPVGYISASLSKDKGKRSGSPEDEKTQKRAKKESDESTPIDLSDFGKEISEEVVLKTIDDYAMVLRTTVSKIVKNLQGKGEAKDFFEIAKSIPREDWLKEYETPSKEFYQRVVRGVRERYLERERKEKKKKPEG